jgi:hypothetical protein
MELFLGKFLAVFININSATIDALSKTDNSRPDPDPVGAIRRPHGNPKLSKRAWEYGIEKNGESNDLQRCRCQL